MTIIKSIYVETKVQELHATFWTISFKYYSSNTLVVLLTVYLSSVFLSNKAISKTAQIELLQEVKVTRSWVYLAMKK